MRTETAVIIGAGPAGMTAAYELAKRTQVLPVVLEATDSIGGLSQTSLYKGNRLDFGGHRFFSKSDRVMDWWFNILPLQAGAARTGGNGHAKPPSQSDGREPEPGLHAPPPAKVAVARGEANSQREADCAPDPDTEDEVMLRRSRLSRIYYRRQFFPYPLRLSFDVLRKLGWMNSFLIGASCLKARLFPIKDETFLDAFFVNRFGRRLYETFFKDYTEKVWGVPCQKMRADWGAQRIKGLSLSKAVVQALRDTFTSKRVAEQHDRETSLITQFYYPKYGPGQLWETVARHVVAGGGQVHRNRKVCEISIRDGRVVAVGYTDRTTGQTKRLECDYVISSMPIKELVEAAVPAPDKTVREVAAGLHYRDFLTVGLLLSKFHVRENCRGMAERLPDNWIYIQDGDVRVGRIQIYNNWSPYLVADPQRVWVGLEYFANEGDELWRMPDHELKRLAACELQRIGLIRAGDVLDGCVRRMYKAYPAYFGTYEQLDVIRDWADSIPNLYLVGRNGMHRYNNQDHSMLTSMATVDTLLDGGDKRAIWDVNAERSYHEER